MAHVCGSSAARAHVVCAMSTQVDSAASGRTFHAAENDHANAIEAMNGADLHKPNNDGVTPLAKAMEKGHKEAAAALRKLGASA